MNELISLNNYLKYTTKEKIYMNVNLYLTNISNYGKCFHREMGNFINRSLINDFGKCNFLPHAYNKMKWLICDYGVEVLVSIVTSLETKNRNRDVYIKISGMVL